MQYWGNADRLSGVLRRCVSGAGGDTPDSVARGRLEVAAHLLKEVSSKTNGGATDRVNLSKV